MKRAILLAVLLAFLLPGYASAMRMGIGASQVSRLDIGAAQESKDAEAIRKLWWWRRRHGQADPPKMQPPRPVITQTLYA